MVPPKRTNCLEDKLMNTQPLAKSIAEMLEAIRVDDVTSG